MRDPDHGLHVTLSDGTTKTFEEDGDAYVITPVGVLEIAATEDGEFYRPALLAGRVEQRRRVRRKGRQEAEARVDSALTK